MTTFSLDHDARAAATKRKVVSEESGWIAPVSGKIKTIGTEETTAQVHPFQFTEFLVEDAKTRGLEVIIGEAHEIQSDEEGSPVSLVVLKEDGTQESVPADDIVFAAGPWTGTLAKKLLGPKAGAAAHIGPRYAPLTVNFCGTRAVLRIGIDISVAQSEVDLSRD